MSREVIKSLEKDKAILEAPLATLDLPRECDKEKEKARQDKIGGRRKTEGSQSNGMGRR